MLLIEVEIVYGRLGTPPTREIMRAQQAISFRKNCHDTGPNIRSEEGQGNPQRQPPAISLIHLVCFRAIAKVGHLDGAEESRRRLSKGCAGQVAESIVICSGPSGYYHCWDLDVGGAVFDIAVHCRLRVAGPGPMLKASSAGRPPWR